MGVSEYRRWTRLMLVGSGLLFGATLGGGAYTFIYARGYSYLTNDPKACANCHVMEEQYAGWSRGSHREVATCNDCHTPPSVVGKYLTKASNGFWHSYYFTTGTYPVPIRIRPRNREIAERACRKCHEQVVHDIDAASAESMSCLRCHRDVGHLH
jgi:cytochrome c nitrite reductase small subunit